MQEVGLDAHRRLSFKELDTSFFSRGTCMFLKKMSNISGG